MISVEKLFMGQFECGIFLIVFVAPRSNDEHFLIDFVITSSDVTKQS